MLHGDIANSRSSCIGIRCEGTLFKINDSLFSKILPFSHRIKKAEVDKQVKSLMDYIFWETEMTVVLVIDNDHYDKKVEDPDNISTGKWYRGYLRNTQSVLS